MRRAAYGFEDGVDLGHGGGSNKEKEKERSLLSFICHFYQVYRI
jgi:hypothetical protein